MPKLRIKRFLAVFLFFLVLSSAFMITAYASSIDSFLVDSSTRWSNYGDGSTIHMGEKNTTYKYLSSAVKNKYSSYVTTGIGLWGSYISCIESSSSPMGTITVSAIDSDATADLQPYYNPSNMHMTSWTLTIYSKNFDDNQDVGIGQLHMKLVTHMALVMLITITKLCITHIPIQKTSLHTIGLE